MALQILDIDDGPLLAPAVVSLIEGDVASCGQALVFLPSGVEVEQASRELAGTPAALGCTCTTPVSWVEEAWRLHGDGTGLVDADARRLLMRRVLDGSPTFEEGGLDHGPGTLDLLCELASTALMACPVTANGEVDCTVVTQAGLEPAEVAALDVAASYERLLHERHLEEPCCAMGRVPGLLVANAASTASLPTPVFAGFRTMSPQVRSLVCACAAQGDARVVLTSGEGPAFEECRGLAAKLIAEASGTGLEVREIPCGDQVDASQGEASSRTPELAELRRAIFRAGEDGIGMVESTGAVEMLEPSGPSATPELVAHEVDDLAKGGAREIIICAPDSLAAWEGIASKLASRGLAPRGSISQPFAATRVGAALLGWFDVVSTLATLKSSWPEPESTAGGDIPRLGDMSWWPPRGLMDFLTSDLSGVGTTAAWALDATWRGDRLLTPAMVLDTLCKENRTSAACAHATQDLLRGRVGSAARCLRKALLASDEATAPDSSRPEKSRDSVIPASLARLEELAVLDAVSAAAEALRSVGIACATTPLPEVVNAVEAVLAARSVSVRPAIKVGNARAEVSILSPAEVAKLPAESADALVYLGLTTQESPLAPKDDSLSALLCKLGVEDGDDPLVRGRSAFLNAISVPREHLLLVRPLRDSSSGRTYPAVMLSELMATYGHDAESGAATSSLPCRGRGEAKVSENLSFDGSGPGSPKTDEPTLAGELTGAARDFVVVPRNGEAALPEGRPSLSASQIEVYLECPYKWFSLRRLGLSDVDAGFSAMQMGTFAHRVLEVTHARLLDEARTAAGLDATFDPRVRLEGSRVSAANLAHATELLDAEFAAHLSHQYLKAHKSQDQALVPHTQTESFVLEGLERDLESELAFESGLFEGFEPRYFELRFGGRSGAPVSYAGADFIGSIDRVDVDEAGHAVVIDYKHKSPAALLDEYPLWTLSGAPDAFELPRRVQTLIYASAARAFLPDLTVVGAVYLGTKGDHALAGAVNTASADRIFAGSVSSRRLPRMCAEGAGMSGLDDVLDASEDAIAGAVSRMLAGDVEAAPIDARACDWCPVATCERRLS